MNPIHDTPETDTIELVPALPDQAARDTYAAFAALVLAVVADRESDDLADWEDAVGLRHTGTSVEDAHRALWPVVATAGYLRTQAVREAAEGRWIGDYDVLQAVVEETIEQAEEHTDWDTAMRVRLGLARVQAVLDPDKAGWYHLQAARWCEACGAKTRFLLLLVTVLDDERGDQWTVSLCEACARAHPGAAAILDEEAGPGPETAPLPIPRRLIEVDEELGWSDLFERNLAAMDPRAARHRGRTVLTDRFAMWDVDLMALRVHQAVPQIEDGQVCFFPTEPGQRIVDDPAAALQLADAWAQRLPVDLLDDLELKTWKASRVVWSDYYTEAGCIGATGDGRAVTIATELLPVVCHLGLNAYLSDDGRILRMIGTDLEGCHRTVGAIGVRAVETSTDPVLAAIATAAEGPVAAR